MSIFWEKILFQKSFAKQRKICRKTNLCTSKMENINTTAVIRDFTLFIYKLSDR